LRLLLHALDRTGADAAAPLVAEGTEARPWLPCRVPGTSRKFWRDGPSVADVQRVCGDRLLSANWAIWASVVLTRRAVEAVGYPRLELWSQFSDVEYVLRLTAQFKLVVVPQALCRHLPPATGGPAFDLKLAAALQNGAYIAFRVPVGRRALRHLPGLVWRYLRHYRWRPRAWITAIRSLWIGAVRGLPSGHAQHAALCEAAIAAWRGMESNRASVVTGQPRAAQP
jgi:GT2 family glycosyltransferase